MFVVVAVVEFWRLNSDKIACEKKSVWKADFEDRASEDPPKAVVKRVLSWLESDSVDWTDLYRACSRLGRC
jgi:hypothetical protein